MAVSNQRPTDLSALNIIIIIIMYWRLHTETWFLQERREDEEERPRLQREQRARSRHHLAPFNGGIGTPVGLTPGTYY